MQLKTHSLSQIAWRLSVAMALTISILFLVALGAAGQEPAKEAAKTSADRVDVVSANNFSKTVSKLETALKNKGVMIVATIDHQNMLTMVGAKIKGCKTIEFGKPDMGKMILPMIPEAGLEMPAKIYVWERADGKTVVSYYKPSVGFARYNMQELSQAGMMMDMMTAEVVGECTK